MRKYYLALILLTFAFGAHLFGVGAAQATFDYPDSVFSVQENPEQMLSRLDSIASRLEVDGNSVVIELRMTLSHSQSITVPQNQHVPGTFTFDFTLDRASQTVTLTRGHFRIYPLDTPSKEELEWLFKSHIVDFGNGTKIDVSFGEQRHDWITEPFEQILQMDLFTYDPKFEYWHGPPALSIKSIEDQTIQRQLYEGSFIGSRVTLPERYSWIRYPEFVIGVVIRPDNNEAKFEDFKKYWINVWHDGDIYLGQLAEQGFFILNNGLVDELIH